MQKINLKELGGKVIKNLSWLFFAGFLVLVLLEIFEINTSLQSILSVKREPVVVNKEKGVRIDFDGYNRVVKRIKGGSTFQPTGGIVKNPFNLVK